MPAAISIAASVNAITIAVPRSGSLNTSRHAAPTTSSSGRASSRRSCTLPRTLGQQRGRVQHQRELHQLRGLELERRRADPAARAVDAHADVRDVHGEHQHERRRQQRRRDAVHFRNPVARQHPHQHQADGAVDHELDEVAAAEAAALQQRRRRGGAVDHHRAERQQAHRRRQQDAVLERLAARRRPPRTIAGPAALAPAGLGLGGRATLPSRCWHPCSLRRERMEASRDRATHQIARAPAPSAFELTGSPQTPRLWR